MTLGQQRGGVCGAGAKKGKSMEEWRKARQQTERRRMGECQRDNEI